jgi:phosphoribosyl-ATP pyrophosphohydrolase
VEQRSEVAAAYEKASKQKLNMERTSLFFHGNTKVETKNHILSLIEVHSKIKCDWQFKDQNLQKY